MISFRYQHLYLYIGKQVHIRPHTHTRPANQNAPNIKCTNEITLSFLVCQHTYSFIFHLLKDGAENLCEAGLSCGLVYDVLASQVDVVATSVCVWERVREGMEGVSEEEIINRCMNAYSWHGYMNSSVCKPIPTCTHAEMYEYKQILLTFSTLTDLDL